MMFFILVLLLMMASVIIALQVKAARAMKVTLTEEIAMRNKYYDTACKMQNKAFDLEEILECRRSVHLGDRQRATKQYRELKDAYLVLHNEKIASLLKR